MVGMVVSDGREIVFAGAGILWGVTTFFRGFRVWRDEHKSVARKPNGTNTASLEKFVLPSSLITGFVLVLGCSAYLVWSVFSFSR